MNASVQSNNSTASSSSALHFSQVATLLLAVVPMNSLLKVSDTVMADIDDEEEEQPEASTSDYSSGMVAVPRQRSYECNAAVFASTHFAAVLQIVQMHFVMLTYYDCGTKGTYGTLQKRRHEQLRDNWKLCMPQIPCTGQSTLRSPLSSMYIYTAWLNLPC